MPSPNLTKIAGTWVQPLLYASGNFGKSAVLATFDTVLFFYLTALCGISLSAAGVIIMTALIWDGFGDLLIGYWADRTGRRDFFKILLMVGAPVCGAAFAALFYVAATEPGDQVIVIALLCWACRIGYTLCDVAHNSMLVNISANERGASASSGLRLMFSAAGTTAVGLAFKSSLSFPTVDTRQSAFATCAALGGLAYTLTLLAATKVRDVGLISRGPARPFRFWHALKTLFATVAYRKLCFLIILQAGVTSLFMKGLPFVGLCFFQGAAWAGDAIVIVTIAQAATLPALIMLGRSGVTSRMILLSSHTLTAFSMVALFLSTRHLPSLSLPALLGIGIGLSGMNMTIWARLALVVRERLVVRNGLHALPIGLFLAVLKCASGLGTGILAFSLSWGQSFDIDQPSIVLMVAIAAPFASSLGCIMLARYD